MLRIIKRNLEQGGYRVVVTGDPRSLPELIQVEEPDMVLLDMILPGTSGLHVLERIR